MFQTKLAQKIGTHISKIRAVYGTLKNRVQPDKPRMTNTKLRRKDALCMPAK
jgi:hypothetical protein